MNPASSPSPIYFAGTNAFRINARFDDSSPNLAPTPPIPPPNPFDGFRAYAPSSMTLEAAGQVFSVSAADNPGLSVSIFDQNSFVPGFYGVGIIVDAVQDGAGIIGDFRSASPTFSVGALVPTEFTGYRGVGHSSGACISGTPPNCPHLVTPIVLRDAGNIAWNLTLANYEMDPPDQPVNMARIVAVPEPARWAAARRIGCARVVDPRQARAPLKALGVDAARVAVSASALLEVRSTARSPWLRNHRGGGSA